MLVASQMFAERAYVEVQMDELAKAAEVAKPTIYRYFNSKEDLFLQALDGTMPPRSNPSRSAPPRSARSTAATRRWASAGAR